MESTERLREMLDERGVEWNPAFADALGIPDNRMTVVLSDCIDYQVMELDNGELMPIIGHVREVDDGYRFTGVTPEDAIGAITRIGACEVKSRLYEGWDNMEDEPVEWSAFECQSCGTRTKGIQAEWDMRVAPKFCPGCGRKLVFEGHR